MRFDRVPGLLIEHQTPAPEAPLRLDVPVFVGVAPRGPARVPVVDARWSADAGMVDPLRPRRRSVAIAIESLDAYRRRFGEIEAGAYLGRAVAAFFAQGGRRCWVMRIVARAAAAPSGRGVCRLLAVDGQPPGLGFIARDEGAWGNALQISLQLHSELAPVLLEGGDWFSLAPAQTPVGSLLRWRDGPGPWQLARVEACVRERRAHGDRWRLQLDSAMPGDARVEILLLNLQIDDGLSRERHTGLGLDPRHPRALAAELCRASLLVWPEPAWAQQALRPVDASRLGHERIAFEGGADEFSTLTPGDFFDPLAPDGFWREDPDPETTGGEGIDALRALDEPALLLVPDLYHPLGLGRELQPIAERLDEAGANFSPCRPGRTQLTPPAAPLYPGLQLDPRREADLARIVELQRRLIAYAASRAGTAPLAVLLDAPPHLNAQALARWRRRVSDGDTPDAATYAPWLLTTSQSGQLVPLPPSAVAAGIVAARERQQGLPFGPAQQLAQQVVMPLQSFSASEADALHIDGINLYRPEPEGLVLVGARTLSREPGWRALAARRVLHWLVRWLQREAPWIVFEPLSEGLVEAVEIWIANLLRRLWRAGALRGRSEAEAFFVRAEMEARMQGELSVEIGLALAEPLEFIVVRLRLFDDGLRLDPSLFAAAEV